MSDLDFANLEPLFARLSADRYVVRLYGRQERDRCSPFLVWAEPRRR